MQRVTVGRSRRLSDVERPKLTALHGDGMSADEAAWTAVAEVVETVVNLPGLSSASKQELQDLQVSARLCASMPDDLPARASLS